MIGNEQGYHIRTSNFYSNEVHDKGDPFKSGDIGQLWASLDKGRHTSVSIKNTPLLIFFLIKLIYGYVFHWVKECTV